MTQGERPVRPPYREEALFIDSDGKLKTLSGETGEIEDVVEGASSVDYSGSKVLYVSKGANATDTRTGLSKYDQTRPFATLTAARSASESGDAVVVFPGDFGSESVSPKTGVEFLTLPGATVPETLMARGFALVGGNLSFVSPRLTLRNASGLETTFVADDDGGVSVFSPDAIDFVFDLSLMQLNATGGVDAPADAIYRAVAPLGNRGKVVFSVDGGDSAVSGDETNVYLYPSAASGGKVVIEGGAALAHGVSGPVWRSGAGSPEGVVAAPVGSLYSRTDGGAGTSFYVKQSGTGNTGWAAK